MSEELGTISGKVTLDDQFSPAVKTILGHLELLEKGLAKTKPSVHEIAGGFIEAEAAMDLAKEGIKLVAENLSELAMRGSQLNGLTENFEKLSEAAGRSGKDLMSAMREGTRGMIDDFELLRTLNKNLTADMNLSAAQYGLLAKGISAMARAEAISTSEAMSQVMGGLLRGSSRALKPLIGNVDRTEAERKWAPFMGVSAFGNARPEELLTAEGKLQAFRLEAMDRLQKKQAEFAQASLVSVKGNITQMSVAWENFKDEIGAAIDISPVLRTGLAEITKAFQAAFGSDREEQIKTAASVIEEFIIVLTRVGEGAIFAGRLIAVAWGVAQTAGSVLISGIYAIATVFAAVITAAGSVAGAFGLISKETYKYLDETQTKLAQQTKAWFNTGLAAAGSLDQSINGTSKFEVAAGKVQAKFGEVGDKMRALHAEQQKHVEAAHSTADAYHDVGTSIDTAHERLAKFGVTAQAMRKGGSMDLAGALQDMLAGKGKGAADKPKDAAASGRDIARTMTEAQKRAQDEVLLRLKNVGEGFFETVARIDYAIVADATRLHNLGVNIGDISAKYPQLNKAQTEALDKSFRFHDAWLSLSDVTSDYDAVLGSMSSKTLEQARAFAEAGKSAQQIQDAIAGITPRQAEAVVALKNLSDASAARYQATAAEIEKLRDENSAAEEDMTLDSQQQIEARVRREQMAADKEALIYDSAGNLILANLAQLEAKKAEIRRKGDIDIAKLAQQERPNEMVGPVSNQQMLSTTASNEKLIYEQMVFAVARGEETQVNLRKQWQTYTDAVRQASGSARVIFQQDLDAMASALTNLGQQVPGEMGSAVGGLGKLVSGISGASKAIESYQNLADNASGFEKLTGLLNVAGAYGQIANAIWGIGKALYNVFKDIGGPNDAQKAARVQQAQFADQLGHIATADEKIQIAREMAIHNTSLQYARFAVIGRDAMLAVGASAAQADQVVQGLLDTEHPDRFAAAVGKVNMALVATHAAAKKAAEAAETLWNPTAIVKNVGGANGTWVLQQHASRGGLVTPHGVEYMAGGGFPGGPKGTDTIPVWTTPGERILSVQQTKEYGRGGGVMIDKMEIHQTLNSGEARDLAALERNTVEVIRRGGVLYSAISTVAKRAV